MEQTALFRMDEDPTTDGSLAVYLEANEDDDEMREALSALAVGASYTFGGGAAAESVVRRIQ